MDNPIPVRTPLTISVQYGERTVDYVSMVMGYGRYGMQVALPQLLNQSFMVPQLTVVVVFYVGETGRQLLSFKSSVMGYERTEPPSMVLALPTSVEAANRRNSLRIPVQLPVSFLADLPQVYGEHTTTLDLSNGGLCMVTSILLPPSTGVTITLDLGGDDSLLIRGMIAWSSFRGRRAVAGVQFGKLKESQASTLAKYLLGLERQSRPGAPTR